MALANTVAERLRGMIEDPTSYQGSTGFRFGLDNALRGAQRGLSTQRGSGNVLAELARVGTGYAQQDYGNEFQRMAGLLGQEQGNDQATARLGLDTELGRGNLALGNRRADQDFGLGLGNLAQAGERNWMDYTLGAGRNANDARRTANDWSLGWMGRNTDWMNAQNSARNSQDAAGREWWRTLN